MKLIRLFGFQFSGSRNKCDECSRLKRYKFRRRSISLRSNKDKCYCLCQKYYCFGFPIIETKEIFSNLEQAEDRYLELYDQRFLKMIHK